MRLHRSSRIAPQSFRILVFAARSDYRFPFPHNTEYRDPTMAEGTIKKLTDKGFGFIDTGNGEDMFFHTSSVVGVSYEDLREGQKVTFSLGEGPKGPRAEDVKPAD